MRGTLVYFNMESSFLINAMALKENGLEKSSKKLKFKNVLLSSKPLTRFAIQVVISTCDNYFILLQTMSPHKWKNGFWNQGNFCLWTPESGIILHVESGILSFGIRNTLQRIRIPINYWNSESKFHWQRLESSTWNPESRIQDCLGFSYMRSLPGLVIISRFY